MKSFINILLLPITLWAACTGKQQQTKDQIPGSYVNHAQSEYSIADDTLIIKADPLTESSYQVTRRMGFRRTNGPLQHQIKIFSGLWDEQKQTLQLTQNGIIILFGPRQLHVQNNKYHKL
jgi:hypothetical protein